MIKRNFSGEDSDSDTSSFYSIEAESSDLQSNSSNVTPVGSFPSLNPQEFNSIENFAHFNKLVSHKKEVKKIKTEKKPNLSLGEPLTKHSNHPDPQNLPLETKKKILGIHIMSSSSGAISKVESQPTKKDEPDKKKKGLKLSFKKKKRDKRQNAGEEVVSGPDSDFSAPGTPSSPRGTLDRNFFKDDVEPQGRSVRSFSIPSEATPSPTGKEKSRTRTKEKSEKRFGSFKLLKKDDKKAKAESPVPSPLAAPVTNAVVSSGPESPAPKSDPSAEDKEKSTVSATAKTTDSASDSSKDSTSKQDPPQMSEAESTQVSNSVSMQKEGTSQSETGPSYVSTFQFSTEENDLISDQPVYRTEVQIGKAEAKVKEKREPQSPIRSFKTFKLYKSKDKETSKEAVKSIAQEIEEVENAQSDGNDLPEESTSTFKDQYQSSFTEVTSQKKTTMVTIISKAKNNREVNRERKSQQSSRHNKNKCRIPSPVSPVSSAYNSSPDRPFSYNSNVYLTFPTTISPSTNMKRSYASVVRNEPSVNTTNISSTDKIGDTSLCFQNSPKLPNSEKGVKLDSRHSLTSIPDKRIPRPLTPDYYAPYGEPLRAGQLNSPDVLPKRHSMSSNTEDDLTTDDDFPWRDSRENSLNISYSTAKIQNGGEDVNGARSSILDSSYHLSDSWAGSSSGKTEHLYKILVIGELGTGKTSIIKRYVHQFFCTHYRATIGVDFALKVLNWDGDTVIRLQLWDIAGQERFGNMTRVYYKQAVGAFIVFDVTNAKTFDAVTKWKTDLDTKVTLPDGSCIPAVLLANKCDQPKEGVVCNPARMDDFCRERNFVGWFETSAKENINIDEATKFLVSKILSNEKEGLMAQDSSDNEKFSVDDDKSGNDGEKSKCSC